jgi:hypothetical protein
MLMRRVSLGKISLGFAAFVGLLFGLHYGNVVPVLNTVVAPLIALLGTLLGMLGYFERDKNRLPGFIGMLLNASFLVWWAVLLLMSLRQ